MSLYRATESFLRLASALAAAAAISACGGGTPEATQPSVVDGKAIVSPLPAATTPATNPAATTPSTAPATAAPAVNPLAVAVTSALIPVRAGGASQDQITYSGQMGAPSDIGAFRINCEYSHMAKDDPIVFPNQPGKSHLHVFFGNTDTDAFSTAESIATKGNSTCRGGTANRTAYWAPAMIDTKNGAPVKPNTAMIYYKTGYNGIQPAQVQTMPPALRMIAGDPKNTVPDGPFKYACVGMGSEALSGHSIQNCPVGAQLIQMIIFPQCWDGVNLDSPDHKSHMSSPVNGACPRSHPVPLPEVSYNIHYDVTEKDAPLRWRLSSDMYDRRLPAGYSAHADWFNGWKQDIMKTFIEKCDQQSVDCHANLLGDGRTIY
jgi:hypothetical protein